MKINYEEIITKANDRKEKLQKLTELLKEQPAQVEALLSVTLWAEEVNKVYAALDSEGRSLLPTKLRQPLEFSGSALGSLRTAYDMARSDLQCGIRHWVGLDE